jgi:hypothetical protein
VITQQTLLSPSSRLAEALLVSIIALFLSSCCVATAPPRDHGFLEHSTLLAAMPQRAPFDGIYVSDPARLEKLRVGYRRLYIEPVSSGLAEEQILKEDFPPAFMTERKVEYRELASYFDGELKRAFETYDPAQHQDPRADLPPNKAFCRFELVSAPLEDTLVLQIALVEITPNIPGVSLLSTLASFLRPGAAILRSLGGGSVGIEGVLRDGNTGDPLLEFRDYRADKIALFSLRNYRTYAHTRVSITEWADEIAELLGTPSDHEVEESIPFTLMPY